MVYSWHRNPATAAIMLVALSIASAVLHGDYLYQDGQDRVGYIMFVDAGLRLYLWWGIGPYSPVLSSQKLYPSVSNKSFNGDPGLPVSS